MTLWARATISSLSFQIENTSVRGRVARLGDGVLDPIIKRHDYPRWAAHLLGEAITLAVLVSASLKFNGKVLVQAQGEGPVSLMVAEARSDGGVRGYLRIDKEKWERLDRINKGQRPHIPQVIGKGVLAMLLQPNDPDQAPWQKSRADRGRDTGRLRPDLVHTVRANPDACSSGGW